jgi:autotransporter-associated beta strand protein
MTIYTTGATLDASGGGTVAFTNTGAMVFNNDSAHTITLTGTNTGANTLALQVANKSSSYLTSLVKNGPGTWVLTNTNSTYTGATLVSNGTLRCNGVLGRTAVTISGGATFGGAATIYGVVTNLAGGHLAPGASIGTLTTSNATLAAGSLLDVEFASGGSSYDQVIVSSNLTLQAGALVNLYAAGTTNKWSPQAVGDYNLLRYRTLTGDATNLGVSPATAADGKRYRFSTYNDGTYNWIQLSVSSSSGTTILIF